MTNETKRPTPGGSVLVMPQEGTKLSIGAAGEVEANLRIEPASSNVDSLSFGTLAISAGSVFGEPCYQRTDVIYFVEEGSGYLSIDGASHDIGAGSTAYVGRMTRHAIRSTAASGMRLTWTALPPGPELLLKRWSAARQVRNATTEQDLEHDALDALTDWYGGSKALAGMTHSKGVSLLLDPDEGASYWQPNPTGGYVAVKLSPFNLPTNLFAFGIQQIGSGGSVPVHTHRLADELIHVWKGAGELVVDGATIRSSPGMTAFARRGHEHGFKGDDVDPMAFTWLISPPGLESFLAGIGRHREPGTPPPSPFGLPTNFEALVEEAAFGALAT